MQISSRFTIALHMLTCMEKFKEEYKITSDFLASSINVNPVIIRRILSRLKDAGLIEVKRGTGGAAVIQPPEKITFLDVYRNTQAIYACINYGDAAAPEEIAERSVCIDDDIRNVLEQIKNGQ